MKALITRQMTGEWTRTEVYIGISLLTVRREERHINMVLKLTCISLMITIGLINLLQYGTQSKKLIPKDPPLPTIKDHIG